MTDSHTIDETMTQVGGAGLLQRGWRGFCVAMVRIFYRRREAHGLERIPSHGAVLLCANHPNALVDPIIIQAFCDRIIHPLARSGLFESRLARPFLSLMQAVPIYRRQDAGADTSRNIDSFARCYELFRLGEILLIFPEGQSHSDSRLRDIKTGAARLARGGIETAGVTPTVLPVGLTFGDKGRFRSSVLLEVGEPIDLSAPPAEDPETTVRRLTGLIESGLKAVTVNAESSEALALSRRLERFFALRRGRYRRGSLEQRFRALRKLIRSQRILRKRDPARVASLSQRLERFERLCSHFGVHDYQLTVRYTPFVIIRFLFRSLLMLFLVLPLALWGAINSAVPLLLVSRLMPRIAKGSQQYDTTRMALALAVFIVAWALQTAAVFWFLGGLSALLYFLSLPLATAAAILMYREKDRIVENVKGFFLFMRKRRLRDYLLDRRKELEQELARIIKLLKR
ncbi:MAG: 1-acyl-sn-glycerol-3-phosphate acyltransferase [Gammaproteobacteria bacterium]|nr:1-acyl-sn-glycerol-3-phosphate acyltransferase [Gammaproteobacteria bacterium]